MLKQLVFQSDYCIQSISYECRNSQLYGFGWWEATDGNKKEFCKRRSCNCQSNNHTKGSFYLYFFILKMFPIVDEWKEDRVTIDDKSLLPVRSVHFGDTGTPFDDKEGRFNVGPLICHQTVGDSTLLTHPVLLYPPAITPSSHNNLPASITFSFR